MRKHLIVLASVLVLAATSAPALAAWGCGARGDGGAWGDSSQVSTKARAISEALAGCKELGGKGCHIIGCRSDIDTRERARELWPPASAPASPSSGGNM
jgi:hypothetical protein